MRNKKRNLNIGVVVENNLFAALKSAEFLKHFLNRFSDVNASISIHCGYSKSALDAFFFEIGNIHIENKLEDISQVSNLFDVLLAINDYVHVLKMDSKIVKSRSGELYNFFERWRRFLEESDQKHLFSHNSKANAAIYAQIKGKNVLNSCDLFGDLGITNDGYAIGIPKAGRHDEILTAYKIKPQSYILFDKPFGNATTYCPRSLFDELRELLKKECVDFEIVISDLASLKYEEFETLLRNAKIFISGDSDFVHLRKANKGGVSVVMFGPTPSTYFGYESNINIQGKGECGHPCYGLTDSWERICELNGQKKSCLNAIHPAMIALHIREEILQK